MSCFVSLFFLEPPKPNQCRRDRLLPPHGWLCCRTCIVATSHPKTLCIFPGSCSFLSEASPSSSALVRSPWRCPSVLSTWLTTERNKEMTVHGEDDSRDPPGSWQWASKCLLYYKKKRVPPDGFLTSGSHATITIVNKRDNCTGSGKHPGPSSARNIFFGTEKRINWVLWELWPV